MRLTLRNIIIHGEYGEQIPRSWGIDKILEKYPKPIKRKFVTWEVDNKTIKFELAGVVSWAVLPDNTGIICVLSSNVHDNAIVYDALGKEKIVINNSFNPNEYKANIIDYTFSRVWSENKTIWLAVACKVKMASIGVAYFEYKASYDVMKNKLSEFNPMNR